MGSPLELLLNSTPRIITVIVNKFPIAGLPSPAPAPGFDYLEIFAPTFRMPTILVLAIAALFL